MDRRNDLRDLAGWMSPEEAAAERARKESEPKRIWGMVLLSGVVSGFLAVWVGSITAFFMFWFVLGVMSASWVMDDKDEGPGI
jgi:hypothetical protein